MKWIFLLLVCLSLIIGVDAAVLTDWDGINLTVHFNMDENLAGSIMVDSAANPNNHSATLGDANQATYVTGASGGVDDYALSFDHAPYYEVSNVGDFSSMGQFEVSFAVKTLDNSTEQTVGNMENSHYKIQIQDGGITFRTSTSGTNCNIFRFEHSKQIGFDQWQYVTGGFNGTHCYVLYNNTVSRVEVSNGTTNAAGWHRIGKDNLQHLNSTIDCFTFHVNNTLSSSARQDAYDDCFEGAAPPSDPCDPPASGNFAVDCSDNCKWTVADEIPGNITLTGTGTVTLSSAWTFTGVNQYIFQNAGCTFNKASGAEYK